MRSRYWIATPIFALAIAGSVEMGAGYSRPGQAATQVRTQAQPQTPPRPGSPAACLQASRDYWAAQMKVPRDQRGPSFLKDAAAGRLKVARECASPISVESTPVAELAQLAELYVETQQPELARAAIDRALAAPVGSPAERAERLVTAVKVTMRQPKAPGALDAAEAYVGELDRLPSGFVAARVAAHAQMNGYYRADDIDKGIVQHSEALIAIGRTMTPEQRKAAGYSLVSAYVNLAEVLAGREDAGGAVDLLRRAPAELAGIDGAEETVRPVLERYLLAGTTAAAIEAPRWLNAPAGTTRMEMAGAVTVLEFTAHWCGPCRESYPALVRFEKRFGPRGFRVVLGTELYGYFESRQNLTPAEETEADRQYFAGHGFTGPIAISDPAVIKKLPDGRVERMPNPNDAAYKVSGIPQIQIIDKRGRIRLIMIGYDEANEERLAGLVERLLAE